MTSTEAMPIEHNWTATQERAASAGSQPAATVATPNDVPTCATAATIARAVGGRDLRELADWKREIAAVVIDLAANAGSDWPFGHDDPTVALLRALGRLALKNPDVTSDLGAQLIDALGSADRR